MRWSSQRAQSSTQVFPAGRSGMILDWARVWWASRWGGIPAFAPVVPREDDTGVLLACHEDRVNHCQHHGTASGPGAVHSATDHRDPLP